MTRFRLALSAYLLATAAPVSAAPADDLNAVIDESWQAFLRNNPVYATSLGERRYDDRVDDLSLAARDAQAKEAQAFVARLDAIPDTGLDAGGRTNKALLRRMLSEQVESNSYGRRVMLFTTYDNWVQRAAGLADQVPLRTRADHESYLARLALFPRQNAQALEITRGAVASGYVLPCEVLGGLEGTVRGVVAEPEASRLYAPFKGAKPGDMSEAEWGAMKTRAAALIRTTLNPELARTADYFRDDYLPKCRKTVGISALPGGADYYAFRVRSETTTDLKPDAIHKIGLSEVARIRAEMEVVAKKAGFADRAAFVAHLRSDAKYYAKTPEELMEVASRLAKTIDGKMPGLFVTLPRLPYGVREIPKETAEGTTTAYYAPGSPPAGLAGNYYVNTSKLDQRPLYEMPALTVHEAVPGHHHQIALQQELDLPPFRKYAAFFTAFVEGWGLYSERLGIEMGLYDTPAKDMGRLSYEMWRACRLVVDTGLHSQGWTKARAVQFMTDNTALSAGNIDAEVNRYISWPGQALAYKLGELRIRELRAKAEKALGDRFDIRQFHDAVLTQGAVPLDVLETQVTAWIDKQKAMTPR